MPTKVTSMRFTEAEFATFGEIAKRLEITRNEAAQLAVYALKKEMGLLEEDTVALQERVARMHGDDALLTFTVNGIDRLNVDVTIGSEPVPDMIANVLFAMTAWEGEAFELPPEATIIAKDRQSGTWYTIGRVDLQEGAQVEVPLRRMPELLQSRADDHRTVEERRHNARMNSLLRRALEERNK